MKGVFGVFIYRAFVIMSYQTSHIFAGLDWFHASGHLDAGQAAANFDTDLLKGASVKIAIISDGVFPHQGLSAAVNQPKGDYGTVVNFGAGEGSRGTAIAGVICGIEIGSIGLAPKTASIMDFPLFRQDLYNGFGANHEDRVGTMILLLGEAIDQATTDGADIIIIDFNYEIFSITAGVSQVALNLLRDALNRTHAYVCLSNGDRQVRNDDFIMGNAPQNNYQLLDSRIPSIRSFVFMIAPAGGLAQPIFNTTKNYTDIALPPIFHTGYGNERMGTWGFVGVSAFNKYEPGGGITNGAFTESASGLAYFAGFLAIIRGCGLFTEAEGKRIARASVVFLPTTSGYPKLEESTGYVDVYTGSVTAIYTEKQIYINGWNEVRGFGMPSFEILGRIFSNQIAGCPLSKSITSDPPVADEILPALFQSVPGASVNPFLLFNTFAFDGWPDLGPNGAAPFQAPADPAFFDRQCPIP